jgi:glycosyltransferase involved in cell wall biosynthesis
MPASRAHTWFRAALGSVLAQTERDFEVIVTDDSGGSLREVVDAFGDPRIRYHSNPVALGFARNHCRAIDEARGEYITFLHDDDMWEPEFLAETSAVMDRHPEVGYVLTAAMEMDENDKELCLRPMPMRNGIQEDPLSHILAPRFMMLLPSLSMFRGTALADNPRPWPDVIAADVTMYLDLVCAGWKIYHLDRALIRYRVHKSQIGNDALAHRHAVVTVWERYSFSQPEYEAKRRERLSNGLVARAGAHLRRYEVEEARQDLLRARQIMPSVVGSRWLLMRGLSSLPGAINIAQKVWALVHDPIKNRHRHNG